MIKIENLKKNYKTVKALKGVSLTVKEGELFAYLGPNGSGKTTTIRILTGLTRATEGSALLNGFDINSDTLKAKRQFGLVAQTTNLDPELTVRENLDIHGRLYEMSGVERASRINELLQYIDLNERRDSPVKQLSGGMKRRVMIARAIMHTPKILFLDEPTTGLDPGIRRKIWSLVKKIQGEGTTVFLTTHYIEEAEFLAQRVAFLEEGEIIAVDSPFGFMERQGKWAVDVMTSGELITHYFCDSSEADSFISEGHEGFTKRRVNLEDAFISITGTKMKQNGTCLDKGVSSPSGGEK